MIDWTKVAELRDEIGEEDFSEVVEIFLEEVDEAIAHLPDNVPLAKVECCLHFLKGSALNLGFRSFSNLCEVGETAARAGRPEDVDLNAVLVSYTESKAVFLAELETRLAA